MIDHTGELQQYVREYGKLPRYAPVGCYSLHYYTADGGTICSACANNENGSLAYVPGGQSSFQCTNSGHWLRLMHTGKANL